MDKFLQLAKQHYWGSLDLYKHEILAHLQKNSAGVRGRAGSYHLAGWGRGGESDH